MYLPTLAVGLTGLLVTYTLFRRRIHAPPAPLPPVSAHGLSVTMTSAVDYGNEDDLIIRDQLNTGISISLLVICILSLVVSSFSRIPVWIVTLPFAVIMFVKDICFDSFIWNPLQPKSTFTSGRAIGKSRAKSVMMLEEQSEHRVDLDDDERETIAVMIDTPFKESTEHVLQVSSPPPENRIGIVERYYPTVYLIHTRMPWRVGPFILSMVIRTHSSNMDASPFKITIDRSFFILVYFIM